MEDTRPPNRHLLILEVNDDCLTSSQKVCALGRVSPLSKAAFQMPQSTNGSTAELSFYCSKHCGYRALQGVEQKNSQLDLALSIFGPLNL